MELSPCPAATVRREGDQDGTLMYKAEALAKEGLNSYLFLSFFFPVFRSLHLRCQHTAVPAAGRCRQGRAVGHAAAQRCSS